MSHIPAAKMPHPHARENDSGGRPDNGQATSEPASTIPPDAPNTGIPHREAELSPSPAVIAMVALGGVAAVAGIVAAVLPLLRDDKPEPKSKKRAKKRKAA